MKKVRPIFALAAMASLVMPLAACDDPAPEPVDPPVLEDVDDYDCGQPGEEPCQ